MQGWRGVRWAQELEVSAKRKKKKKDIKHSTAVGVSHQMETGTSELTAPELLSIHLHTCKLGDSNRAMYLSEGKKMALSFGIKNFSLLPVTCLSVSVTSHRANSSSALQVLSWSLQPSVQQQYQSHPAWAAKAVSPVVHQKA